MDVIDQATDAVQADLRLHLDQTGSQLPRAIEEALARIDRQAFGVCETCKRPISPAGQMPCPGRASTVTARSGSKVERLSSLGGRHLDRASALDRVGDLWMGRVAHRPILAMVRHPFADLQPPY